MTSPTVSQTSGNTYVPQFFSYELEEKELRPAMVRRDTQLAIALNLKENGVFETVEVQNGQQFFGNPGQQQAKRFGFRKAFVIPDAVLPIVAGGTSGAIAHGITGITAITHISGGVVTAAPDFRALPHASASGTANIEVLVTATTYTINNGATGATINSGILVLEYLKN